MSTNYEKLIAILREVFMLDKAELDFGIYRIMNQKRVEIEQFLEKDLVPQVEELLGKTVNEGLEEKQVELKKLAETLRDAGLEPETSPKYMVLQESIASYGNPEATKNEVFSHLTTFFKRYYDNGDFISQRRYKKDVYAIPYEGEEVKLHWANADQYYIKTSEYLKNYGFKLDNGKRVQFVLTEASTEQNNNKTQGDKERRFALDKEVPFREDDENTLSILFIYEPVDKKIKQKDLNEDAVSALLVAANQMELDMRQVETLPAEWRIELAKQYKTKTKKDGTKDIPVSWLEYHITQYTARNTFDYFIHKDLDGFLTRELDFYIKNEVLFLDDINTANAQDYTKTLSKLRAIKGVGGKIIAFLAQLEDFQKKLWLKKKFVVEANYCITLDRIDEKYYPEIAANDTQREEWVKLFAIDEIKETAPTVDNPNGTPAYSNPLTVEFMKANQYLLLDTAFYNEDFKDKLLADIQELCVKTDGLMANSDNFQLMKLLEKSFFKVIEAIYIDPPYNTKSNGFHYKDGFKHSSWITMMHDRITCSYPLLANGASFFAHIDENEHTNFSSLLTHIFGEDNRNGDVIWKNSSKNDESYISMQHEYIVSAVKDKSHNGGNWVEKKEGLDMIFSAFEKFKQKHRSNWDEIHKDALTFYKQFPESNPISESKHYSWMDENGIYFAADISGPNFGQYVYDVIHPITGKVVKAPKSGWRFPEETMQKKIKEGSVHFGKDETTVPNNKTYLKDTQFQSLTSIKYKDGRVASKNLNNLFGSIEFKNPKDQELTGRLIKATEQSRTGYTLDYFAGSGTTGHAVINLNREDGGSRKYILVEMGTYFDSVTKPRIQKVVYSKDWKDGKPVDRNGISHMFKYMRLESYEDTLNNLELVRSESQGLALQANPRFKEGYMLQYMLDVEAQGSLLNLKWFENPFEVYLNITQNNETTPTKIDLAETFNYLIGLTVGSQYTTRVKGCKYKFVTGTSPEGEKVLVVWRDVSAFTTLQESNNALNEYLEKSAYNPLDTEYDVIYVNCDNNVENLKTGEERWKVRLIEQEFSNQMFS